MIREPPLDAGASKFTMTELMLALAQTWRGALGRVAFVAANAGDDVITDKVRSTGTAKISLKRDTYVRVIADEGGVRNIMRYNL